MLSAYRDIDNAVKAELNELFPAGIAPVCKKGCCSCCRQKVPIALPESHVLAQHIKRNFSTRQKDDLHKRTAAWFDWVREELPKHGNTPEDELAAFCDRGPHCPLLVKGTCSVYPARPFVCRTHFEFSSPENCRSYTTVLNATDEQPIVIRVLNATKLFAIRIKESVEANGVDFEKSMVLLPQGLASELGWNDLLRKG